MDFPVIEVQPDWSLEDEPMGSKEKFWVKLPNDSQPWLFKYSRVNAGVVVGEHWSEKLAAEFAELLGVPHARVELALCGGQVGCLSRKFDALANGAVELVHGNELLAGVVDGYDRARRRGQHQHTLQNILHAVSSLVSDEGTARGEAFRMIGGFVVLDALILNTDRHHENWAMFRRRDVEERVVYSLAPSFDHASSLGRELTDRTLRKWQMERGHPVRYARKGTGGVYLRESGRAGANPLALAEVAYRLWPACLEPWLVQLRAVGVARLLDTVARVPETSMGPAARWFVRELVQYTYERLGALR